MSGKAIRRGLASGVATLGLVALVAGSAGAHFCFKTNLNPNAAAGMAGSANWVSFADIAAQELPDLCPAGVEFIANAAGATPETLINGHGTMAGGTLKKGPDSGNKAISHLDFEALEAAIPEAFELC